MDSHATSALHDKPFPLQGVKILDFAWFLASAGGTRFLAALGAESYKVEWKDNPDTRLAAMAPVGGRAARDAATGPLPGVKDPDMGGQFNNKNAGKRGISLNIRHPKGLAIAKDLVRICDIVAEGFSPGVLQRLGLGYDVMRKIRPDIIYIQQAGMGAHGTYGRMRTGRTRRRGVRRPGRHVGAARTRHASGLGLLLPRLDGRLWLRARPARRAVPPRPHRRGPVDRRLPVRIRDFPDRHINSRLVGERPGVAPLRQPLALQAGRAARRISLQGQRPLGRHRLLHRSRMATRWPESPATPMADDPRFATLADRLAHQDALDAAVSAWTATRNAEDVMMALQNAGVPAGVCQNAEDRCDNDPQLRHLKWLTEVTGTKIGTWPVYELPMKLSRTPAYIGGPIDRGAPAYGEDNAWLLTSLLGMTPSEVERLAEDGVI